MLPADRRLLLSLNGINGPVPVSDFFYAVHISLKYRYIYVASQKVACSTIKRTLINAEFERVVEFADFEDMHQRHVTPLLSPRQAIDFAALLRDGFFTFCFVRNPYERLLSVWLDKIARNRKEAVPVRNRLGLPADDPTPISFAQFVSVVEQQSVAEMDAHWRTQYHQTFHPKMPYAFVGRFESFEADFRQVCARIGLDFDRYYVAERSHATGAAARLDAHYTPDLRARVARKYALDFDTFNYAR